MTQDDQGSSNPHSQSSGPDNENAQDVTKCAFCGKVHAVTFRVLRIRPRGLANICRDCLTIHAEEYLLDNTRPFNPWSPKT